MVKTRVGLQLKEAIMGQASTNKKENLEQLTARFERMRVNLRQLIEALRAQHLSLLRMNDTQLQVALKIAAMAQGSALEDQSGLVPMSLQNGLETDPSTYVEFHSYISAMQKTSADRYLKHVVEYAIEWEKTIVNRVTTSIKLSNNLRRDLDHYQSKVDSIKQQMNTTMSRGKMVDTKTTLRLRRNEEKQAASKKKYETFSKELCKYLEEVVMHGWKDVHPLLLKLVQFDVQCAKQTGELFGNMGPLAKELKKIGEESGLGSEGRLKELATMMVGGGSGDGSMHRPALMMGQTTEPLHSGQDGPRSDSSSEPHTDNGTLGDTPWAHGPSLTTSEMMAVAEHAPPPPTMEMVEDSLRKASLGSDPLRRTASPSVAGGGGGGDSVGSIRSYSTRTGDTNPFPQYNRGTSYHSLGSQQLHTTNTYTSPFGDDDPVPNPFGDSVSTTTKTNTAPDPFGPAPTTSPPFGALSTNPTVTTNLPSSHLNTNPFGGVASPPPHPQPYQAPSSHPSTSPYRPPPPHVMTTHPERPPAAPFSNHVPNATVFSPPSAESKDGAGDNQTYYNPFD